VAGSIPFDLLPKVKLELVVLGRICSRQGPVEDDCQGPAQTGKIGDGKDLCDEGLTRRGPEYATMNSGGHRASKRDIPGFVAPVWRSRSS